MAGPAIAQWARTWAEDDSLPEDTRQIVALARGGQRSAQTVIDRVAAYLAVGLVNVVMLLTPELVVFGGGVMQNFDLFEPALRAALVRVNVIVPAAAVRLAPAQLGDSAGVVGAGYAAWSLQERVERG